MCGASGATRVATGTRPFRWPPGSKEPTARFVIDGSYFVPRPCDEIVERDGFRIHFAAMHRPLEAYFHLLEQAGFLLEALREPRHPENPRWARVPLFLHVRAVRP